MPADLLIDLTEQIMKKLKIKFENQRIGSYKCQRLNVIMTVDLVRVGDTDHRCVLFKRLSGDSWVYKELCTGIL